jgi:hypothetical protein
MLKSVAPKRVALTTLAVTTLGGVVAEQTPAPLIIAEIEFADTVNALIDAK